MPKSIIVPLAALALAAGALSVPSAPAEAQLDPNGTGNCKVGGRVALRDGQVGTVVRAEGSSCHVKLADGTERYALQWMLTPAGGAGGKAGSAAAAKSAAGGKVVPGNYQCYGGAAGNMKVKLTGPRYLGSYAVPLPDGRVGLSNKPNGPFYMTCERR